MADQREGGIAWTDQTWNPIRGCSRVSEGCRNCYAERVAARFSGPGQPFEGLAEMRDGKPRWTGTIRLVAEHLADPLKWKRPRRIFVNSVSDLFHDGLSDEQIAAVFGIMMAAGNHTFQVLTKRPKRMLAWFEWVKSQEFTPQQVCESAAIDQLPERHMVCHLQADTAAWPLPNVWLGVSVENQAAADERIPLLLETPAAVRFLSCEPLLGAVDLLKVQWPGRHKVDVLRGGYWEDRPVFFKGFVSHGDFPATIDWVIAGGESGRGARPMHASWLRGLRDQCWAAGTPFLFKQWGDWAPAPWRFDWTTDRLEGETEDAFKARAESTGSTHAVAPWGQVNDLSHKPWSIERVGDGLPHCGVRLVGKKAAGNLLDGRTWDEFPTDRTVMA